MTIRTPDARVRLAASMLIFSTIGILRRYIPYPSSLVALIRGVVGAVFLICVILLGKQRPDRGAIRKNLPLLVLSGALIGFNWIFLFESYRYTSVAVATLCYYLAPVLVILGSAVLFREKLSGRQWLCVFASLAGMSLVSGVWGTGIRELSEMRGVLYGLAAAVLYACVILMNKGIQHIGAYDKTVIQLSAAAAALLPYVLFTGEYRVDTGNTLTILLLLTAGILHTGVAYSLYFSAMSQLPAHTIAMLSYIDPIGAVLLSLVLLGEPLSPAAAVGAVLILVAAYLCEKE